MSIIKRALIAVSLVVSATAAQAQQAGGANAIGVDNADAAYTRATPVRPQARAPRTGLSGGANAIGVDEAYGAPIVPVRSRVYRAAPAAGAPVSGAQAIGVDK